MRVICDAGLIEYTIPDRETQKSPPKILPHLKRPRRYPMILPPKLTISRLNRIQGVWESLGWHSTAKPPRPIRDRMQGVAKELSTVIEQSPPMNNRKSKKESMANHVGILT